MIHGIFNRIGLTALLVCLHCSLISAQEAYISGKVTNQQVENLLNASVSIGAQTGMTDSRGEFSFSVKAGKYHLIISHVGYRQIEETIIIQAGETKKLNYQLMALEELGEEVVLQSHSGIKRSNFTTPVRVEVIHAKNLIQTGQPSLVQMLSASVPSVNISRQQVWDPITFRGFNPDQVLILVDGSRFHQRASLSPVLGLTGHLGKGSVLNDLYAIPFPSIEKIEILQDGSSAQYGSDAIAAVVNIILKKATDKTFIQLHTGQYYKGDGQNIDFGINHGSTIFKKGYLNLSGNFHYRAPTFRGNTYAGTVYYEIPPNASPQQKDSIIALDNQKISERGFDRTRVPPGYESLKLFSAGFLANGGIPLTKSLEIFWTGILNYRFPTYLTSFRFPKNEEQVNIELFPDGFLARSYSPVWDISFKGGAQGRTNNNWKWNVISSYGKNKIIHETHNNNNASQEYLLGAKAQTDFECGAISFSQYLNKIHFTKPVSAFRSMILSLGSEWRLENYQLIRGEEASWKNYDSTGSKQGGVQNGGISDSDAVNVSRHVLAMYGEIETEINDHLLFDKAIRFESYSGYGNNLAAKLAARYRISGKFIIRGSAGNSFRAPPLQQAYYSSTISTWMDHNGTRIPAVFGIFRNAHDVVARGFGVPKLKPEKAINTSLGVTFKISSRLDFTADAYWVQVKDRLVFSGRFTRTNPAIDDILQQFPHVSVVQFVCNAVNTRTLGADIVLRNSWQFLKSQLAFTLAANLNRTRIFGIVQTATNLPTDSVNTNTLFNRGESGRLEKLQPSSKIIFTTTYNNKKWALTLVNRRFGSTEFIHDSDSTRDEFFSAKIVTDLNIKFSPATWYSISVGCNNIFNITPDAVKNYLNTNDGRATYGSQYLPFSPNGRYFFISMNFNW